MLSTDGAFSALPLVRYEQTGSASTTRFNAFGRDTPSPCELERNRFFQGV